jgi:hypothetical protein
MALTQNRANQQQICQGKIGLLLVIYINPFSGSSTYFLSLTSTCNTANWKCSYSTGENVTGLFLTWRYSAAVQCILMSGTLFSRGVTPLQHQIRFTNSQLKCAEDIYSLSSPTSGTGRWRCLRHSVEGWRPCSCMSHASPVM